MNIIFGPVSSRRFGLSLGVDLSPHKKQCNFDCVYCELKASKPVEKIDEPIGVDEIIKELKEKLNIHKDIKVITLTANGEPSLYPFLEELIEKISEIKGHIKLLILSNGSTISREKTRNIFKKIDIVKLSLDSVSPKIFKKIDRANKGINVNHIINGMIEFSKIFKNELVLEILVVKNINDIDEEFIKLNEVIQKIKPSRVDIGTIHRPPAYDYEKVEFDVLNRLSSYIKNTPINIITSNINKENKQNYREEDLLELIKRRPQSIIDVEKNFTNESNKALNKLIEKKKIKKINIAGSDFFIIF